VTRSVYRCLLWLHPPGFRRQFGGEMLWIFDEAAASEGRLGLLFDGMISLLRQWVVGCGAWKLLAAAFVAALQLMFFVGPMAGIPEGGAAHRPIPAALDARELAFSQGLLLVFVLLVGLIGFLGVFRARTASRH
jgi:hypothetical protein